MKKKITLIVCLFFSIGCVFANNLIINDGISVMATSSTGNDKSSFISASIDGHNLTVNFLSDIGHVWIKITDEAGVTLEIEYIETPRGYLYYMPSAGHYVLVITLSDGDEYEGEFDVTE